MSKLRTPPHPPMHSVDSALRWVSYLQQRVESLEFDVEAMDTAYLRAQAEITRLREALERIASEETHPEDAGAVACEALSGEEG